MARLSSSARSAGTSRSSKGFDMNKMYYEMDETERRAFMHQLLVEVRDANKERAPAGMGICAWLTMLLRAHIDRTAYLISRRHFDHDLRGLVRKWPEHSGSTTYPVPCPQELVVVSFSHISPEWVARRAFNNISPEYFWDKGHPYGAARCRLLEFLIEETRPVEASA